jgi:hypothetical protein
METMTTKVNRYRLRPDVIERIRKDRVLFNAIKTVINNGIEDRAMYNTLRRNSSALLALPVLKIIAERTGVSIDELTEQVND